MFDLLSSKFSLAFKRIKGEHQISADNIEATLKDVKRALLEADVNFKVVKEFITRVSEQALGEKVLAGVNPGDQFVKIIHDELASVMGEKNEEVDFEKRSFLPVLVVGLNGQGKTTFSGKFARYVKEKKKKNVLLVPADTFRPAAKEQLQTLGKQVGVDVYDSDFSLGPVALVKKAIKDGKSEGREVLIIDTAGRLHVDGSLMDELRSVYSAIKMEAPEVLLVADAMTGQEAVNVAKSFQKAVSPTGIVLSKMDSDAKGGAALSIRFSTGIPIKYLSTGERMEDLELFHPDRLAGRILDMGDVVTLVEKAVEAIDEKEAESMMKNLEKGRFTLGDFVKQMEMLSRLGPMASVMKMIPGMGDAIRQAQNLSGAEEELKRYKVMISSMTRVEREDYKLIDDSRAQRIARGSGHHLKAVKDFLFKFRQMEQMMGGMMKMMKSGGMQDFAGGGMMGALGAGGAKGGRAKKEKKVKKRGPWGNRYF